MDFFKFRNVNEENGAGDEGTPSLVAKYKNATPGQTSAAPARQPARKGDKLNAKMDHSNKIKQDDITVKTTMKEDAEEIDELKVSTLTRYGTKATQALGRNPDNPEKDEKRIKGIQTARAKVQQKRKMKEAFEDPEAQKAEMALTKLHFIEYAAEEIMEYIEMGAPIEEWYQIKLAKVHADMEGLHSYMEGEKRRTGMMGESTDLDEAMKPYVSGTAPRSGEKGSYDVMDKNGKVVKSYPYTKGGMQMAQSHVKKIMNEGENKQMKGKDPCWKGYQMVGTKKGKGGKEVPNCVPVTNEAKMDNSEVLSAAKSLAANGKNEKTKSFGKGLVDFYNKNNSFTPDQVAGLQNIMKNASFQMAKEGVMKNIKRQLTARDADSRAGEEAGKMMKAQQSGDNASATKYNNRFKKLSALTKKESYVQEKLDPSQGAGEYVKDFQKSDAPQFKGKSKKERQKMAVAAYLGAKDKDVLVKE